MLRSAVLVLCMVSRSAAQMQGEESAGQQTDAAPPPPVLAFEVRLGKALPDWLLEDGNGRRFTLAETPGKPFVLAVGFASLK